MKFGYSLTGFSLRQHGVIARAAESAGFDSLWLPEHIVFPAEMPATYPYTADGLPPVPSTTPLYDPWVVFAAIAAQTSTIMLATNLYILPLRHPLAAARSIITLDRVSGGRVIVGVGLGWLEEEFEALGESFKDRGARTEEAIAVMRRLWTEREVAHDGRFYSFDTVNFEPKPVRKQCPPIHLGGAAPAALRRMGRIADGWIEVGNASIDELAQSIEVIMDERAGSARAGDAFEITVGCYAGDPTEAQIAQYESLGVTRLILAPPWRTDAPGVDVDAALAHIEHAGGVLAGG